VSQLVVDVPASLEAALEEEKARSGRSMSSLITAALAQFSKSRSTLFFKCRRQAPSSRASMTARCASKRSYSMEISGRGHSDLRPPAQTDCR
jgi:hypothetical protein